MGQASRSAITRADVKKLLEQIDAPILANQILASASAIFTWAIRQDVAGIKINPCTGIERNKTTNRERVLSDIEVPLFWSAFESAGVEGMALKAILLTGQRPGEVANMNTEHIAANWWKMPGEPVEFAWLAGNQERATASGMVACTSATDHCGYGHDRTSVCRRQY